MLRDFLLSIFVGAGAIAPGLSGGTLAIIFGLYERSIDAISSLLKTPVKSVRLLLPIGAGVVAGIVMFSTVQRFLLERYLMQTMFCFMGLIIGSLPYLFREANEKDPINRKNAASRIIPFMVTFAIGILLTYLDNQPIDVTPVILAMNPIVFIRMVLVGILIAASLIIPGVSGTVLLVMIGQYSLVLDAVSDLKNILSLPVASREMIQGMIDNILVLIPLTVGAIGGGLMFAFLIHHMFRRWHGQTYAGILGFVVGSVFALYPVGSDFGLNTITFVSLALMLAGIALAYWFSNLEHRKPG